VVKEYSDTSHEMTSKAKMCHHCGNSASMAIICKGRQVDIIEDPSWGTEDVAREWEILMCTNCSNVNIFQISHSSFNEILVGEDYKGEEVWDRIIDKKILFPSPKRQFAHLPIHLDKSFSTAVKLKSIEPIASALFVGRTLEFMCKDVGAEGKNLYNRIEYLGKHEYLPKNLVEMAQNLRVFRNIAAHDPLLENTDIKEEDADVLCNLCAVILEYFYELPAMLNRVKEKINSIEETTSDTS